MDIWQVSDNTDFIIYGYDQLWEGRRKLVCVCVCVCVCVKRRRKKVMDGKKWLALMIYKIPFTLSILYVL